MKLDWRWEPQFCVADIGDFANVFVIPKTQNANCVFTFHINLRDGANWKRIWDSEWFPSWDEAKAAAEDLIDSKVPFENVRRTVRAVVSVCD